MSVEITTQQMGLTRDTGPGGFMERLQLMLYKVATDILSEPGSTAYHHDRAEYAKRGINSPSYQAVPQAAPQIVMGVNVINTTTYDEATGNSTCSIADIDLQSQIMTLWNALAGIDTPTG